MAIRSFTTQTANPLAAYGGAIKMPSNIYLRIGIFVIVVAIIFFVFYYFYKYLSKTFNVNYKAANNVSSSSGDKECEILLFSTTWCPHCKSAKPIWEEVKQEYANKSVNGYTIVFTEVDCTNESPDVTKMMDRYKIEGYPTIKLIKDGQVIEFDAKVTKSNLEQFINTAV